MTAIEVELFEVSRIYGGGLFFPAESAAEALHFYSEWAAGMPEEMSSSFFMLDWPDADGVPQELRGKFALHLRLCYLGSPEEGERLVQPLRDLAPTLLDTVVDMPYTEVGTIHNDPPTPGCYHINTFQLSRFDHEVVDAVLAQVGPGKKSAVGLELRQLGGALARPRRCPTPSPTSTPPSRCTRPECWASARTMPYWRTRTGSGTLRALGQRHPDAQLHRRRRPHRRRLCEPGVHP
ncbi:hypothetical protein ACR6C2_30180 [Streptomyces sp. INA 01156]